MTDTTNRLTGKENPSLSQEASAGRVLVAEIVHLPECQEFLNVHQIWCICPLIRACEQRVLDAARKAVRHALGPMEATDPGQHDAALAAIDSLRDGGAHNREMGA